MIIFLNSIRVFACVRVCSLPFLYIYVGPKDSTQVAGFCAKHCFLLSLLADL